MTGQWLFFFLFFLSCNMVNFVSAEGVELPQNAKVKVSTDKNLEADSTISLAKITLEPGAAVLLQFPYTG